MYAHLNQQQIPEGLVIRFFIVPFQGAVFSPCQSEQVPFGLLA